MKTIITLAAILTMAVHVAVYAETGNIHSSHAMTTANAATFQGVGVANKIDPDKGTVNISHQAIHELGWPAMTMDFKVADKKLLNSIKAGQKITFNLYKDPQVGYLISSVLAEK